MISNSVLIGLFSLILATTFGFDEDSSDNTDIVSENRNGKFYPFTLGFVRFENGACRSASNLTGTCYTKRQCSKLPGIASGRCARRLGVCCVVQRTCGDTSSSNNTYFVNPGFPNAYGGGTRCTMSVQRCNPDICQLRLDFLSLTLAQPDNSGRCSNDALSINGAATVISPICGENTGHHMYMDFNGDTNINIVIETSSAVSLSRYWNIKATQIECDSPSRAPSGCLMYYTGLSGIVRSFNYGTATNPNNVVDTREIANLNYGVCIGMAPDHCSIRWSQTSDTTSFTVSGMTNPTTIGQAVQGIDCVTDYVVIPNPVLVSDGTPINTDRFCGNGFTAKSTSSKPFVLTVVTNGNEMGDENNRGFALNYQQQRCVGIRF